MTGTDRSELAYQEQQRREQRKKRAGVAGLAALLLILLAFVTPWLLGRRQVSGGPRAVATLQEGPCWNWIVTGGDRPQRVADPPDSWLGSTSIPGELSIQGEEGSERLYFVAMSGERFLLGGGSSSCRPPPTTAPPR